MSISSWSPPPSRIEFSTLLNRRLHPTLPEYASTHGHLLRWLVPVSDCAKATSHPSNPLSGFDTGSYGIGPKVTIELILLSPLVDVRAKTLNS